METNLPAISVILPVHNGERFLSVAIDSVLARKQVYNDNTSPTRGNHDLMHGLHRSIRRKEGAL